MLVMVMMVPADAGQVMVMMIPDGACDGNGNDGT